MVSGSRIEGGNGTQNLSAGVRRTIQSIKEIVGHHSDVDIYTALKEANMDPNETTQKLLNQDPFHEVKRKRDKKKENTPLKISVPIKPRKPSEHLVQGMKPNTYLDRNHRRPSYGRNNAPDARVTREFRIVKDNRINQNGHREIKKSSANTSVAVSTKEPVISNVSEKSSSETTKTLKPESENIPLDSISKQTKGVSSSISTKTHDSQTVTSPNSSVVGVYSSSSDPVHIPSLASRQSPNVGAIKREVGAVGVRRHTVSGSSKTDHQPSQSNVSEPVPTVRSLNNHYTSRPHQQAVTHQKGLQGNKEWKPKSSQKSSVTEVGVIGTPKKPATSSLPKKNLDLVPDSDKLGHEDQNVIIAAHIRVSETDRCRLTFGSLGIEVDSSQTSGYQEHVQEELPPMASLSVSSPDSSGGKQVDSTDERVQSSGSVSPVSDTPSDQQSNERLESSSPHENYTNIRQNSPSEPQQQQPPSELPSFSQAYDHLQTGYDISYFRPSSDESLRGQVLQVPQEGFSTHVPATTIPMVQQQQQQQVPQMYPQVHLPHFANLMPYRQFLSPVYGPPMVMPAYSNNPTYSPHPSTGSSYLLMPGANVNSPNGLKYTIPQYKSLQAGSPTGFGNFTSPTGYALNTPGVVGSGSGLDDSSRIKYKDGNVYVPNPQAETSELWMNPREIPGLQSGSYYNMAGQTPYGHAGQTSHMQFPGLYHAGQAANPHHMGPTMGGNVGVGVAAGAPGSGVGGYQQPQLGQLSWTGNF